MPTVVLATAQVPVYDVVGGKTILRALLDTGSSASFITERALKRMRVSRRPCPIRVNSVGADESQGVNGCVSLALGYVREGLLNYIGVEALIMNRVVGNLPQSPIAKIKLPNVVTRLADPLWNVPGPIDLLLGADVYYQIVTAGAVSVKGTSFIATIFGFVISGLIDSASTEQLGVAALHSTLEIDLERFWQLEEVPDVCGTAQSDHTGGIRPALCKSTEEKFAEDHFMSTHRFDETG